MKAQLIFMSGEMRRALDVHLWSVWDVLKVEIVSSGRKYPRETKWIYCKHRKTNKTTRFLWYEVEVFPEGNPGEADKI